MSAQTFTDTLTTVDCPSCGIVFGITEAFERRRREDHRDFYCPSGHSLCYPGQSAKERKIAELEREVARRKADAEWYQARATERREEAERARRQAAAARGVVTRIKRRVAKGVCPCCKRYFVDLHRHMQGQHPEFQGEVES